MDAAKFLTRLDLITNRQEDIIRKIDSTTELPSVYVFVYRNWPEPGLITGFTFGLSAANHEKWQCGRPELMISMASDDESWLLAMGYTAEQLRGSCPFCYGDTINFHERISQESMLDAFLVFAPPWLTTDQRRVDLGEYLCHIAGFYPIYSREMVLINRTGAEDFWKLKECDIFDPKRPEIKRRMK